MAKAKISDRHVEFVNLIAAGEKQSIAYLKTIGKPETSLAAATSTASKLMAKPEFRELLKKARDERAKVITQVFAREIAKEFKTPVLTIDEMDAYHSAIIQGLVTVEEVVPVWHIGYDKNGTIRNREQKFVRVHRPPNVREKQISIDAIYKRFGAYAPSKFFGALAKVNEEGDLENVQRMVILSNGEKVPLEAIISTP